MRSAKNRNGRRKEQAPDVKQAETPAQKPEPAEAEASRPEESEQMAPAEEIRELRREEYDRHIKLFQFYCDISLRANIYFYLITGGITSFYFSALSRSIQGTDSTLPIQDIDHSPLRFIEVSFLLPIFMSGVLGGVFFYGRSLWIEVVESIEEIRDDLSGQGLSIKKSPEVGLLASLLLIFGCLFFLVGGALTVLMAVQMKNRNVWSASNSWDELLRNPRSYLILSPAVLILASGLLLPFFEGRINWAIKSLRQRRRRRKIRKWSAELQNPKLDNPDYLFKDSFLYYKLRPYLGEGTIEVIKNGEFNRSLIIEDLEKLKIRWGLARPDLNRRQNAMTTSDAPAACRKESDYEKTNAARLPMVGWYDPRQLFKTGIEVAISTVFGRHSDFRIVEALSSDPTQVYDYTFHYTDDLEDKCELDPKRPRDSIWIDYVGDVGDGWNSTYAVAYNLALPEHAFKYKDPKTGEAREWETKRGEVLVFGGDQVYPTASRVGYEQRLVGPYRTALPCSAVAPAPHVFAIPGNHDWYDSLVSFTRLFTSRPWFGGWRTRQSRSYFALKLPRGWWLLGTDFQLASDIDAQQRKYFEHVSKVMDAEEQRTGEEQRIVLCHAEPHWIHAAMYEGIDPSYNESNLFFLEDMLGGRVAVFIAGDLHHYRRHEADDDAGVTQKITAGGGGAFLHPTHYGLLGKSLDEITEAPREKGQEGRRFKLRACFPPKEASSKLCWRNLIFPYLKGNASRTFGLVTAALYLLTTLSVLGRIGDREMSGMTYDPGVLLSTALAAVLNSHLTLFWVLLIVVGFVFFTDTHSKPYRVLMGGGHGLAHALAAFAVALVSVSFVTRISGLSWVWGFTLSGRVFTLDWRVVLAGALILLGGFVFGSLVMGLYLLISMNLFGRHSNEAFSSISVEDWKNFLRLHIDERGTLTIYPVGFPAVPRSWRESTAPKGPEVLPDDPAAPGPELIEPPIVIEKARTKKGTAAG